METVPTRTDAPEALCPTCGAPGEGASFQGHGITTANYLCPAGHIWQTKWLLILEVTS
jgi:hypothetical protein